MPPTTSRGTSTSRARAAGRHRHAVRHHRRADVHDPGLPHGVVPGSRRPPRVDVAAHRRQGAGARHADLGDEHVRGRAGTPTTKFLISDEWPVGSYLLKLVASTGQQRGCRSPCATTPSTATYVVENAVTTWQAYNRWGGCSLYLCPNGHGERSQMVSFDRPYDIVTEGSGDFVGNELPLIMRAEELNLDVTYITSLDLHAAASWCASTRRSCRSVTTSTGRRRCSTAWSRHAATRGVNLAFFGANAVYRQIRFEPSALGADRHMVNYRSTADPIRRTDPAQTTVQFRDAPVNRPEAELIGQMYQCNPVRRRRHRRRARVVDLGRHRHDDRVPRGDPGRLRVRPVHPRPGRARQRRDRRPLADLVSRTGRLLRRHVLHGAERRRVFAAGTNYWVSKLEPPRVPRDRVQPDRRDRHEERAPGVRCRARRSGAPVGAELEVPARYRALGGDDLDGDAVDRGVARQRVDEVARGEQVVVHAGVLAGDRQPGARPVVAPAVGEATRRPASSRRSPRPATSTLPASERDPCASRRRPSPAARRRRGGRAACSGPCPSRAPSRCASTSCSSAGGGGSMSTQPSRRGRRALAQPGQVGEDVRRGRARCRPSAVRRISSARGAPSVRGRCRAAASLERCEREPVGRLAVAVAPRAACGSCRSSDPLGPAAGRSAASDVGGVDARARGTSAAKSRRRARSTSMSASACRRTCPPRRVRISHSCGPVGRREDAGRATLPRCAPRQHPDQLVEVRLLERRRARAGSRARGGSSR